MKPLTIKISPDHELHSDITKHLDTQARWAWFGLRMIAYLEGRYPCVGTDLSIRANNRRIARKLRMDAEDWIVAKYELINLEAISTDEVGRITIYEGRDKGDRIKQGIVRETSNHIKEVTGRTEQGKPLRDKMMMRIYEGATLEDFKAVIDRAVGMATKEQRRDINFFNLFSRGNFWDWVVKARSVG